MPDFTAIKIRLYPTKEQQAQLDRTFGCCRFLWNHMLAERQAKYKQYKLDGIKAVYKTEKEYKAIYSFLKAVDSSALQATREHLEAAYDRFYTNCTARKAHKTTQRVGLPQFKSRHKAHNTFTTKYTNDNIKIDFSHRKLKIPKLNSWISYRDDRVFKERIRNVTLSKTKSGQYYASILIARANSITPMTAIPEDKVVAFDMSMTNFVVTKDYKLHNPRFFRKALRKVVKAHRKVSRSMKKSKNRFKARRKLAKVYEQYVNQKKDWTHKITKKLADQYDVVILEDLNIKGMARFNKGYAKNVTKDFSWGEFSTILSYKMQRKGKYLVKVGRFFPSSQLCSACGYQYRALELTEREWDCPSCNVHHDRDINASRNLHHEGLRLLNEMGITLIRATGGTPERHACRDYVNPLHLEVVVEDARIPPL